MAYGQYRAVTIDQSQLSADLVDFPFLIQGVYDYLATVGNGGKVTSNSGFDIQPFSDTGATDPLDYELESYDASSGAISIWIRVPAVSASVATTIYLMYGNSSITTDQSHPQDVWDSDFMLVAHVSENAANTTIHDSTVNVTNGAASSNTNGFTVAGRIAKALNFNAARQIIFGNVLNSIFTTGQQFTLECWCNLHVDVGNEKAGLITKAADSVPGPIFGIRFNNFYFESYDGTHNPFAFLAEIDKDIWHHGAYTRIPGADPSGIGYKDGVLTATLNDNTNDISGSSSLKVGGDLSIGNGALFPGLIDEIRISKVARPAGYFLASYNNQVEDSTFWSIGVEVPFGGGGGSVVKMRKTNSALGTRIGSRQVNVA